MDRDKAIELISNRYFSSHDIESPINLIKEYLADKEYDGDKIGRAVNYLLMFNLLSRAADVASEHFERKFNIYKLWSAPNPLNNQGQERKVILIF